MKKSNFSPDEFMNGLYESFLNNPYENAVDSKTALQAGELIKNQAKALFSIDCIPNKIKDFQPSEIGKPLIYPKYTLRKYSVEICKGLTMLFYMLEPNSNNSKAPGVVALCGHGYGVRQILNISKKGNKKRFNYLDNYQKNFAAELAERGCIVIAPELCKVSVRREGPGI